MIRFTRVWSLLNSHFVSAYRCVLSFPFIQLKPVSKYSLSEEFPHLIFIYTLVMESLERLDLLTIYLVACCLLSVLRGIVPLMGGSLQNYCFNQK
ncbi:hypothetical protein T09_12381 [Trichinella sp. T9]|nr:hypothetical protein T09_12381 [Trichinella sp. T9]